MNKKQDPLDLDPPRDAELARLLGAPVGPDVDWQDLQARIRGRAALPLARRRKRPRWVGAAAGISAAACLALAVRLAPARLPTSQPVSVTELELERLISGEAERDALLQAVLEGPNREG